MRQKASVQKTGAYQYDCQHKNLPVKEGPCQTAQGIVQKHQGNSSLQCPRGTYVLTKGRNRKARGCLLNTTGSIMTNTARITYFTLDSSCVTRFFFYLGNRYLIEKLLHQAKGTEETAYGPSHGNPKEQENSQYIEGKLPVHGGQGILQGT